MNALEVLGLAKSYPGHPVLADLELSVAEGSFSAILGPSGSGKTTLLRVIAGFERADSGTVRLAGVVVDDGERFLAPAERRIGYVPQDGSLFPHLSVEQNVAFGLPRAARRGVRVATLMEMVGIGAMARRYPHQLSGGQQQRVALARALAIEPELVLLDEPFSSLDAGLRAQVRADVRDVLRTAGTTALLVTHDREEAFALADHVALIHEGRIGQYDTPESIYARPANAELALVLGEANLLEGTVEGTSVRTVLGELDLLEGPRGDGPATVMLRPEQLSVHAVSGSGAPGAEVLGVDYFGHDAIVRLRPDFDRERVLVARTLLLDGSLAPGARVKLAARGPVMAWERAEAREGAAR